MCVCMYVCKVSPSSFVVSPFLAWLAGGPEKRLRGPEKPREKAQRGPERPREAQRSPERPTQDLGGPVALDEAAAVMYTSLRVS